MSDDLRKVYLNLIEPEVRNIHAWLDVPERPALYGQDASISLLAIQSEILHLIEVDRRVTLLEAQWLNDR